MTLNPDSILALAPDSGSAANGKKLATLSKWQNLNAPPGGQMLWGEAQGSGKDPYLVGVDLNGLVSKCSCPSRKFPCKHALALMLLYATSAGDFGQQQAPESLQTWLRGRQQRAEAREDRAEETAKKEADPAAQAKRRAAREKKVSDGLAALDTFLKDMVRGGLAHASQRPYSDWDTQAARLIDAQAGGAARLVRQIPDLLPDPAALLTHLAKLHLMCEAWTRRDTLSEGQQADLRTAIGFPVSAAEVLAQPALSGAWVVAAQFREEEENLTVRRTWLACAERRALLLDFAPAGRPLPPGLPLGAAVQAELCYVPSATPQRAMLRGEAQMLPRGGELAGLGHLDDLLAQHAALLARNPWLERSGPYRLLHVRLLPAQGNWWLCDQTGQCLPMRAAAAWAMLAQSGGQPISVLAEWDGATLNLLPDVLAEEQL